MTATFHIQHQWPRLGKRLSAFRRWIAFNLVGGLGIVIQLFTLAALTTGVGLNFLASDYLVFPQDRHA